MSFPNFQVFLEIENNTSAFLIQDSWFFLGVGVFQGFFFVFVFSLVGGVYVCVFQNRICVEVV